MNTTLLLTKFHMPTLRSDLVPRPRLFKRLSSHRKLTLICASAGFGKTTLASYKLADENQAVAWLSLDESDNDPQRFFTYLVTALNRTAPDLGQSALDALQSTYPPPITVLLSHVINDLSQTTQRLMLVLDDYHLITVQQIHDALTFLLENLPPQLRLVIISRTEPPLPIAKLRAKDQLTEIHAGDLRFTLREAEAFLNETMKLSLSGEQITQLENQTEGWITGLQLAALSLKENPDADTFIHRMSGIDRYITDYLVAEVLSHQPAHIQKFLLKSSILGRMNADLCNTLLKISNSQIILESLEKSNLFITPLDHNRRWYRYHHLFAKMMQNRLSGQAPERIADLHRSAAKWFMAHNMPQEAIEHLLEAKDYARVIEHLDAIIEKILAGGKFRTYLNWLSRVPKTYLPPSIALYQLFFLHEMGEFKTFAQQLKLVEQLLGPFPQDPIDIEEKTAEHFGILAVIKGIHKAANFAIDEASSYLAQALRLLPENLTFWRILSLGAEGFCHRVNGNYAQCINIFSKVVSLANKSDLVFLSSMYSIALAKIYLENGQIENALHTCRTLVTMMEKQEVKISFAGLAYVVMGRLLYFTSELAPAEKFIHQGLDQVIKDGDIFSIADAYFTLAQIYVAQEKTDRASATMSQLHEVISSLSPSQAIQKVIKAYQAHIHIIISQPEQAKTWIGRPGYNYLESKQFPDLRGLPYVGIYRTGQQPLTYFANFIRLITARFEMATNNIQEAIRTLDDLLTTAEPTDNILFKSQVIILKSLSLHKLDKTDEAVSTLVEAIELVAPEPLFQIFINEGQPMRHLLENAQGQLLVAKNHIEPALPNLRNSQFIAQILDKMPAACIPSITKGSPFDLTPREIDVLNCLAQGLTYSEAAEQLFVSINTFKSHIKNIYSKLDVTNRTQAVNKANDLNLLDAPTAH